MIGLLGAGVALLLLLTGASVAREETGVVIALGDSITAGGDTNYPQYLNPRNIVRNEGIPGNGLVAGPHPMVSRLDTQGAHVVVLLGGINDIQAGVSADALIEALDKIRAQTRHVRLLVGTLPPWRGWGTYTDEREAQRQRFNDHIRASGEFVDFDALLRDPADPLRLRPEFDSGDHLHPNDAAFRTMARAVDV